MIVRFIYISYCFCNIYNYISLVLSCSFRFGFVESVCLLMFLLVSLLPSPDNLFFLFGHLIGCLTGVSANMFGLVCLQICLVWCVCKYVWFGVSANIGAANLNKWNVKKLTESIKIYKLFVSLSTCLFV